MTDPTFSDIDIKKMKWLGSRLPLKIIWNDGKFELLSWEQYKENPLFETFAWADS